MNRCRALVVVLLAMVGCSSTDELITGRSVIKALEQRLAGPSPADTFTEPTRAALAQDGRPFLRLHLPSRDRTALLQKIAVNGGVETWATADGSTFSFRDGVLTQTRGLGPDLMSASLPSAAGLAAGRSDHPRVHYYLGPNDQTVRLDLTCTVQRLGTETITIVGINYTTARVSEHCQGPDTAFENVYWFDGRGRIRQSEQWISPTIGKMQLSDLRP